MSNKVGKVGEKSQSIVKKTISTGEFAEKMDEKSLSGKAVSSQIRFLAGRILTIIDASFPECTQKKSIKDLIRNEVADTLSHITTLVLGDYELVVSDEEAEHITETSLEEAIN
ncbi:MAG: hypothetical protein WC346_03560 [Methanogenium sp.]|jgi:hypothetical protein